MNLWLDRDTAWCNVSDEIEREIPEIRAWWENHGMRCLDSLLSGLSALRGQCCCAGWVRGDGSDPARGVPLHPQTTPFVYQCVASASGHHLCNRLSHSVSVTGSTGTPEAERPQGRKQPAQVKSGGKLEPTRQPRRETRVARPRLDCLKPNPERMIKGPAETLVRRRRALGADPSAIRGWQDRPIERSGSEPGSRDEWAT